MVGVCVVVSCACVFCEVFGDNFSKFDLKNLDVPLNPNNYDYDCKYKFNYN